MLRIHISALAPLGFSKCPPAMSEQPQINLKEAAWLLPP
jgi:hypothetical protein